MKWYKIEDENLEKEQSIRKIKVNGKFICLVKTEDRIFACAAKCPHAGADISQGWIDENCQIVCPFHRYKYHLKNGRGATGQGDYIEIYPVELRVDGTYVQMSENWFKRLFRK